MGVVVTSPQPGVARVACLAKRQCRECCQLRAQTLPRPTQAFAQQQLRVPTRCLKPARSSSAAGPVAEANGSPEAASSSRSPASGSEVAAAAAGSVSDQASTSSTSSSSNSSSTLRESLQAAEHSSAQREAVRNAAVAAASSIHSTANSASLSEQPPETGLLVSEAALDALASSSSTAAASTPSSSSSSKKPPQAAAAASETAAAVTQAAGAATASVGVGILDVPGSLQPSKERRRIRDSWNSLMRWSRYFRSREEGRDELEKLEKVVVFGGGSFGTAMAVSLARQKKGLQVTLLLRDPYLCKDINDLHCNTRYLKDYTLPSNVTATTSPREALAGAQLAIHAVPVQHTRTFLQGIKELIPPSLPIVSVSKGIEVTSGQLMSEVIPSVLGKKQPTVYLSGPSFAKEVMMGRPTCVVAASKDKSLARTVQQLFASPAMRVNTSTDVIGVEICGSLKNVLAIAAGIVEGLELGPNAMAALVAQGCAEIRWLATKMGGKPATISGLSGLGDIMLTCYGSLSRNRTVGVRLGQGEKLQDILASSSQVAEGVATAEVVVDLARKYRVQLPVLTAVAQVVHGHITARQAVFEIMSLPQVEER